MPSSPDFRARSLQLLDTARDDDTLVVASATPDGHLHMQTRSPTPHGLVEIARALLSQANDELDRTGASEADAWLANMLEEALAALPQDGDEAGAPI